MTAFQVRIEVFEGPLDLLLTLVKRESLDISSLSLARVTNQFLDYFRRLEVIDVGALAEFCEVAAALILHKSRSMLPRLRQATDDEEPDPGELESRLRAYERYRQVAEQLGRREAEGLRAFVRIAPAPPDLPPRLDPSDVGPLDLAAAFRRALESVGRDDEAPLPVAVMPHTVRLADRLVALRRNLATRGRLSFLEVLTEGPRTREFVIVSFLAVLELLRRRSVRVVQDDIFGEIMIEALPGIEAATVDADDSEEVFQ